MILAFSWFVSVTKRIYVPTFLGFSIILSVIYPQLGLTGIIVYFIYKYGKSIFTF
jgi:hypothetical protein